MDKSIKEQLAKCRVIAVPKYKDSDTEIVFGKQDKERDAGLQVSHCYEIRVDDYIIHPYSGFTLHDNWNKGVIPTDFEMNAEIMQILGKMIKIHAIGKNDGMQWEGWIPIKSMQVLGEI